LGINKVRKANDSGLLGEIVNVAGMHSLRRTAVIEIFENKQDLRLAQAFWDIKTLTTSNYLQDSKRSIQDQLRECLC
jgi:hypothetical protein